MEGRLRKVGREDTPYVPGTEVVSGRCLSKKGCEAIEMEKGAKRFREVESSKWNNSNFLTKRV